MKRALRYLAVLLILLVVFCIILCYCIDHSALNNYLIGIIVKAASAGGVTISIEQVAPFFVGFSLTSLKIAFPQALLSLKIDSIQMNCSVSSLFSNRQCHFDGTAYKGSFSGEVEFINGETRIFDASLKDLHLESHPQIQAFGIQSGNFSADIPEIILNQGLLKSIDAKVSIQNFSKPDQNILPPALTKLPFAVAIPSITSEKAYAKVAFGKETLSLENITVLSNLGSAESSLDQRRGSPIMTGRIFLTPTESGITSLKPFLLFLCPENVIVSGKKITIQNTNPSSKLWDCRASNQ